MGMYVIAHEPAEFTTWLRNQAAPARRAERAFFDNGCASCHTIRGTDARGDVGPDLTHVGARSTLAALTIPNTPRALHDPLLDPVKFVDRRSGAAKPLRRALRHLFPDHWSFLLGEVALYAFVVLIATGTFLALFFEPSLAETTYDGEYAPLRRAPRSEAYASVLSLSFDVKAAC